MASVFAVIDDRSHVFRRLIVLNDLSAVAEDNGAIIYTAAASNFWETCSEFKICMYVQ